MIAKMRLADLKGRLPTVIQPPRSGYQPAAARYPAVSRLIILLTAFICTPLL